MALKPRGNFLAEVRAYQKTRMLTHGRRVSAIVSQRAAVTEQSTATRHRDIHFY